jgi:glucokinase
MNPYPYVIIPSMVALIAVDIGGTTMRAASFPADGILPIIQKKTATEGSGELVFDRLIALIDSVWPKNVEVAAISVATPGPLDPKTGFVFNAPNIPGWKDLPLGEKLKEKFQIPTFIGNDANFAAVGEWKFGAGVGHHDLIFLTISTGVGGGIICKDQLLEGHMGLAAELGHITILPDGPVCPCGKPGHLEAFSSGTAITQYVKQMLAEGEISILQKKADINAFEISQAARMGDQLALRAYHRAGLFLGKALASFIHIFNPSLIILGGGVSQSGSLLFDPTLESLQTDIMDPIYLQDLKIVPAMLGDDAGLFGALAHARERIQII